jgi:hypothetical protein
MPDLSGSCLCGSVQYSSTAEPAMTAICHCRNCQKQTGTSFSLIVAVPDDSMIFENKESLRIFEDTGETGMPVHRHFCGNCGSPIMSLVDSAPGLAFIKAGTLTDRSWLEPTVHIWCDTAQPWVKIEGSMAQIPRNPAPDT